MKVINRWLALLVVVLVSFGSVGQVNAEESAGAALGATLSEDQRKETLEILGAGQLPNDKVLSIDGVKVDEYLHDGSDESTDIYSSAYIEVKPEGYGVQVQILTPDNITEVSDSMYQSAAITAGAHNVLIKIASVEPVTGEGALTGLYEVFEQEGFALDQAAIDVAEKQLTLEQKLSELTDLSTDEISKLINEINLAVIDALVDDQEVNADSAKEIVQQVLSDLDLSISDEAEELLIEHAQEYAQSPAANDASTKRTIEESTKETIVGQTFINGGIEITFDDVYLTTDREDYLEEYDNVLVLEYTLKNNHDEEYYTGNEFSVYVDGHKAEDYHTPKRKSEAVAADRTVSVYVAYGFNGDSDEIELEFKDHNDYDGQATIIPAPNVRDEADIEKEAPEKEEADEESEEAAVSLDDLDLVEKKDGELLVPGEYKQDELFGQMTLLKINEEEQSFMVSDELELIVQSVKLFDMQGVNLEDPLMESMGFNADDNCIQVVYSLINHSDQELRNTNIDRLVFSDGEQMDRHAYTGDEPFELAPNAKVSKAFFINRAPSNAVTSVELLINYLLGEDNHQIPTEPVQVKLD